MRDVRRVVDGKPARNQDVDGRGSVDRRVRALLVIPPEVREAEHIHDREDDAHERHSCKLRPRNHETYNRTNYDGANE